MPRVKDVVSYFTQLIPPEMKTDSDNVGLLVGLNGADVKKALIALDITEDVIDEAIRVNAQMIFSHHPIFFDLKQINDDSLVGRKIIKMLANGISGFCQHTNLDCVSGGVNDTLADKLGVIIEGYLEGPHYTLNGKEYGMGRFGRLSSPVDFEDYLCDLKFTLNSAGLRYHNAGRQVSKVALCGGSGGEYIDKAIALGCDTLVTSDIKYHQFLAAKEMGLNLIDADHFCTENVVVPVLAKMLKNAFPEIEVAIAKSSCQTAKFY